MSFPPAQRAGGGGLGEPGGSPNYERWATFDCYGTLIDWNAGLRAALGSDELLERYHEVEPQVQEESTGHAVPAGAGRGRPPDRLLPIPRTRCRSGSRSRRCGRRSSVPVTGGWRLVILSNTDRDYIEASMARIGVPFELAIVALGGRLVQACARALARLRARGGAAARRPRCGEPLPRHRPGERART